MNSGELRPMLTLRATEKWAPLSRGPCSSGPRRATVWPVHASSGYLTRCATLPLPRALILVLILFVHPALLTGLLLVLLLLSGLLTAALLLLTGFAILLVRILVLLGHSADSIVRVRCSGQTTTYGPPIGCRSAQFLRACLPRRRWPQCGKGT